jgi:glucose/arabinose dehydrogenase
MRPELLATAAGLLILTGCAAPGSPDPLAGFGPDPQMPQARKSLLPTVGVPKVVGWSPEAAPHAPQGFVVTRLSDGLAHPRWLYVLPNGDVLVAESGPPKGDADKMAKGVRGFFQKMLMKKVGSTVPSAERITLLRDADGDGRAELKTVFAQGLKSPFGMTLTGGVLYVANTDGVVSFPYADGQTKEEGAGQPVFDLPGPPINHHWTKNVVASPDGAALYATVGSNSNVGDNGMAAEKGRAAIWRYDLASRELRQFATGLRNPNGLDFEPQTGAIWTVANERDEIGADTPPDYLTSVRDGGFYGWPYSYWGQHVDARVKPQDPAMVAKAIKPDYGLGAHTASLGLTFYRGDAFPAAWSSGAYVGQHGSWNRKPLVGYQVVFVPFADGRPQTPARPFLTGFLNAKNEIQGRPVGVVIDRRGALLVADDVGGVVWRVAPATVATARAG